MKRICCVCAKVEMDGQWEKIPGMAFEKVSHVYCPVCYETLMDEVERFAMQHLSKPVYSIVNIGQLQAV